MAIVRQGSFAVGQPGIAYGFGLNSLTLTGDFPGISPGDPTTAVHVLALVEWRRADISGSMTVESITDDSEPPVSPKSCYARYQDHNDWRRIWQDVPQADGLGSELWACLLLFQMRTFTFNLSDTADWAVMRAYVYSGIRSDEWPDWLDRAIVPAVDANGPHVYVPYADYDDEVHAPDWVGESPADFDSTTGSVVDVSGHTGVSLPAASPSAAYGSIQPWGAGGCPQQEWYVRFKFRFSAYAAPGPNFLDLLRVTESGGNELLRITCADPLTNRILIAWDRGITDILFGDFTYGPVVDQDVEYDVIFYATQGRGVLLQVASHGTIDTFWLGGTTEDGGAARRPLNFDFGLFNNVLGPSFAYAVEFWDMEVGVFDRDHTSVGHELGVVNPWTWSADATEAFLAAFETGADTDYARWIALANPDSAFYPDGAYHDTGDWWQRALRPNMFFPSQFLPDNPLHVGTAVDTAPIVDRSAAGGPAYLNLAGPTTDAELAGTYWELPARMEGAAVAFRPGPGLPCPPTQGSILHEHQAVEGV